MPLVNIPPLDGGGGAVDSVFGRSGAIVAEPGDYNTDQVTEGTINKYTVPLDCHNNSGVTLTKGTPVYVTGTHASGKPTVAQADNSDPAKMPCVGVLKEDILNGADGFALTHGALTDVDTSSASAGEIIYVGTVAGDRWTSIKPVGTALIQNMGYVLRSHATAGSIEIQGSGRTNDLPNIEQNYIWVGNASGVPEQVLYTPAASSYSTAGFTRNTMFGDISEMKIADTAGNTDYVFSGYGLISYNGVNYEVDKANRNYALATNYALWYSSSSGRIVGYRTDTGNTVIEGMYQYNIASDADATAVGSLIATLVTNASWLNTQIFRNKYVPWGRSTLMVRSTKYLKITPNAGFSALDSFGRDTQPFSFGFTLADDWICTGGAQQMLAPDDTTKAYFIGFYAKINSDIDVSEGWSYGDNVSGPFDTGTVLDLDVSDTRIAVAGDVIVITYNGSNFLEVFRNGTKIGDNNDVNLYMKSGATSEPVLSFGRANYNSYIFTADKDPTGFVPAIYDLFICNGVTLNNAQITEISAHGDAMQNSENYNLMHCYIQIGSASTTVIKGDVSLSKGVLT